MNLQDKERFQQLIESDIRLIRKLDLPIDSADHICLVLAKSVDAFFPAKEATKPEGDLQELRKVLADTWRKHGQEKIVAFKSRPSFSGEEIAIEIESGSEVGNSFIKDMIMLAVDLTKRDKVNGTQYADLKAKTHAEGFAEGNTKGMCEKCGGRLCLVGGVFYYEADPEPYKSGKEEGAELIQDEQKLSAASCDNCGHLQNFIIE